MDIYPKATIDDSVNLGTLVTMEEGVKIEANTGIGYQIKIGSSSQIGQRNVIENSVTIEEYVLIV